VSARARRGPVGWCHAIVTGLWRSVVLIGLTGVVPAITGAVAFFGGEYALSRSATLVAPPVVRLLAAVGELAMALLWCAVALTLTKLVAGRWLSQATRQAASRWLGLRIEVRYQADHPAPVTRMATGFWWNGYEYHRSERDARRGAEQRSRLSDRQERRDTLWFLVAGLTVLPVAAIPVLAIAGGTYLAVAPGHAPQGPIPAAAGAAAIVAGLAIAPVAWRVLGPIAAILLGPVPPTPADQRIADLESVRADLTQAQAAELERIERSLHDGAQARLVALGMSMGAAEHLVDDDPEAAKAILAQARASSAAALDELRSLVRGINPPVLAERGLVDAVRALALDAPVDVTVRSAIPARLERPVESAVYFAIAELLANVAKHARASQVTVDLDHDGQTVTVIVADDGTGGALPSPDSGLSGIGRRLAAFGGSLDISSPVGGPTLITVAVPCALS
jgi:signal transduction histidine kinase